MNDNNISRNHETLPLPFSPLSFLLTQLICSICFKIEETTTTTTKRTSIHSQTHYELCFVLFYSTIKKKSSIQHSFCCCFSLNQLFSISVVVVVVIAQTSILIIVIFLLLRYSHFCRLCVVVFLMVLVIDRFIF